MNRQVCQPPPKGSCGSSRFAGSLAPSSACTRRFDLPDERLPSERNKAQDGKSTAQKRPNRALKFGRFHGIINRICMRRAIRHFAPLNGLESRPPYDLLNLTAGRLCYGDLIVAVGPSVGASNTVSAKTRCEVGRTRRGGSCSMRAEAWCGAKVAEWATHRIAT